MAGFNSSDISFAITKETVAGTTPVTGAWLKIDHVPGTSPMFTTDSIESPVKTAKRASAGNRKTNPRAEGGLKTHLCRDAAIELLMQSACSGVWTEAGDTGEGDDILKAGDADTSLSIEKKLTGAASLFTRFTGCQVTKMTLTVDASSNAEISFDILGMGRVTAQAPTALTYSDASNKLKLAGEDVNTVSIGSMTGLTFRSLELTVEQTRETKDRFGSASAFGVGASGNRKVTLKLTFYREDFQPETVLAGNVAVPVSFTIGGDNEGFKFDLPLATASIPADVEDGAKVLVDVEFMAKYSNAAGTDFQIIRL